MAEFPADPVRVGVIGAGDISDVYLRMMVRSPALDLVAVAARDVERAGAKAATYGARGESVSGLLGDPSIELVVNLAPAASHDQLNRAAISAGKHLYSEKPFALSAETAQGLAALAEKSGRLVGGAPDTFYGAAHQAARAALDAGEIGAPVFGTAAVGHPGIEHFHPDPEAFYRPGGEGPLDIGPYHILQWVNLLGPVRRVACAGALGAGAREIRRGPRAGLTFDVDVPTSFSALLWFETGHVAISFSLDVADPRAAPAELHGTHGIIELADPNFFGGAPRIRRAGVAPYPLDTAAHAFGVPNRTNHGGIAVCDYRGVGIVELAMAARGLGTHRANAGLITHVTEVATALVAAAREERVIDLVTRCERPAPLGAGGHDALLRALAPSPY